MNYWHNSAPPLVTTHPDYGVLASRILISNHHKNTHDDILNVATQLYHYKDIHGMFIQSFLNNYKIILDNHEEIQEMLMFERDYNLDYFGFKTSRTSIFTKN